MDNLRQIIRTQLLEYRDGKTEPDVLVGNNPESTDQLIDNIIKTLYELKGQDIEPYKEMLQNMFKTIQQVDTSDISDLGLADS
jgi:hypothetical protein